MAPGEVFVGIQFCWDGAETSSVSVKPFWPLCVSILNFPRDLRDKVNLGMHVVGLCGGCYKNLYAIRIKYV